MSRKKNAVKKIKTTTTTKSERICEELEEKNIHHTVVKKTGPFCHKITFPLVIYFIVIKVIVCLTKGK